MSAVCEEDRQGGVRRGRESRGIEAKITRDFKTIRALFLF